MSAFLHFLADLTVIDWLFILGAWLMVAFSLGTFTGLGIKRADERDPVFRIVNFYPPAVPAPVTPPLTQTVPSADWFLGIPCECLGDDAVRALCDDIERREFS